MRSDREFSECIEEAREYLWKEIEPRAKEWDKTGDILRGELGDEFKNHGFLGVRVPAEFGGLDLTHG